MTKPEKNHQTLRALWKPALTAAAASAQIAMAALQAITNTVKYDYVTVSIWWTVVGFGLVFLLLGVWMCYNIVDNVKPRDLVKQVLELPPGTEPFTPEARTPLANLDNRKSE